MQRTCGGISYELTYKKVKNLNLRVKEDGSVHVSAPRRVPVGRVDQFVAERLEWIKAARERIASRVQVPEEECPEQACLACFTEISDQVFPLFADYLGGEKPELRVRWMKTRWGVCCPAKRRITLNRQLYKMPRAAVEYVVLHEYMHFLYPNHQKEFHEAMAKVMPDYKARRALLKG